MSQRKAVVKSGRTEEATTPGSLTKAVKLVEMEGTEMNRHLESIADSLKSIRDEIKNLSDTISYKDSLGRHLEAIAELLGEVAFRQGLR